jgi:hypothetical protein
LTEEQHDGGSGGGSSSSSGGGGGRGSSRTRRPRVVSLPQKRELNDGHMAQLRASGLTDETIRLADLYTESNRLALARLINWKVWPDFMLSGLVFPLYLPGEAQPYAYRVRPSKPRQRSGKAVKYESPVSAGVVVYFAPRARAGEWYREAGRTLYWTEGEKKALVFDQIGLACVGLCGVSCFHDVEHREATNQDRLHALLLEHCTIAGRHHVICFDADARDNEQVMMQAARLCGVLGAAGAASVRFVCPPNAEQQKGFDDYFAAHGEVAMRALLEAAWAIEPADPRNPLVRARSVRCLRDAPVPEQLRISDAYEVRRDGTVWRLNAGSKNGPERVSPSAILIQRYLDDRHSREGLAEVCWYDGTAWVSLCVTRQAVRDRVCMLRELVPFGAPITSNSAGKVIDWLESLDSVNATTIPRIASVDRAGWHAIAGARAFVLNEAVGAEGVAAVAVDTRGDRRRIFGALAPRGTLEAHLDALRRAWAADSVCAAMICGALAAPLLEPLGAPNFAIHLPGESSRGKTTMLKIAASVYGDPESSHWLASWNSTHVGAEYRAATLCDLPQCYDEVGGADVETTERLVYSLINGTGRTRGQRDGGVRETPSWRTIVLSTGERSLAGETAATGAQVRVVHLPVGGFGELAAQAIDGLRAESAANAGCFGRAWIASLVDVCDWAPFRAALTAETNRLRADALDPLQGRVAGYFALLYAAERWAAQLGLGDPLGRTMEGLYRAHLNAEGGGVVEGIAQRARALLEDWVMSSPDAFPELFGPVGEETQPRDGRPGQTRYGFRKGESVLVIPAEFRKFCAGHRLDARAVVREWSRLGWTRLQRGRLDCSARVGNQTARFVLLLPLPDEVSS